MYIDDKKLGYAIIIFMPIFCVSLIGYLFYLFKYNHYDLVVTFPNLGILAVDNSVKIRGKYVGMVKSIERKDNKAVVCLEMSYPVKLKTDYQINERDRGLMGDREIEIIPGTAEDEIDISKPVSGNFIPGIANNIAMANNLIDKTMELRSIISQLAYGDSNNKSFTVKFNKLLNDIDRLSRKADEIVYKLESPMNRNVAELHSVMGRTRKITSLSVAASENYFDVITKTLNQLEETIIKLNPLVDSAEVFTRQLQNGSGMAARAFRPVSYLDTLATMLGKLQKDLAEMRHSHLNINFF